MKSCHVFLEVDNSIFRSAPFVVPTAGDVAPTARILMNPSNVYIFFIYYQGRDGDLLS